MPYVSTETYRVLQQFRALVTETVTDPFQRDALHARVDLYKTPDDPLPFADGSKVIVWMRRGEAKRMEFLGLEEGNWTTTPNPKKAHGFDSEVQAMTAYREFLTKIDQSRVPECVVDAGPLLLTPETIARMKSQATG